MDRPPSFFSVVKLIWKVLWSQLAPTRPLADSELLEDMRRIKQLEDALERKTLENEILKEAMDLAKAKNWIARSPDFYTLNG